jgi:hypothetical protein
VFPVSVAGVVAVVPSFSRPLVSMLQRVAVALATGNSVVICPPASTPLPALLFAQVLYCENIFHIFISNNILLDLSVGMFYESSYSFCKRHKNKPNWHQ